MAEEIEIIIKDDEGDIYHYKPDLNQLMVITSLLDLWRVFNYQEDKRKEKTMGKVDPALTYDYEDTPKFMAQQEMERKLVSDEIERRVENGYNG